MAISPRSLVWMGAATLLLLAPVSFAQTAKTSPPKLADGTPDLHDS